MVLSYDTNPEWVDRYHLTTIETLLEKFKGDPEALFLLIRHIQKVGEF
jgi:hypothetical protein